MIQHIDKDSIHRICSSQAVTDLATAVKEVMLDFKLIVKLQILTYSSISWLRMPLMRVHHQWKLSSKNMG